MACPAGAQHGVPAPSSDGSGSPVSVLLGADVSHDSNLFRQPSSGNRTSDTISTAYVGLRIDKQFSLQRFHLDISQTVHRYAKTTQLNSDSLDYRGSWLWQVGSRVAGTLSADRKEALVPFEDDPGSSVRNMRTSENRAFTLDARVLGDWHLLLGVTQMTQKSERAVEIQPDFEAVSYEAGIKYAAPTGSSVSVIRRSVSGDYTNQGGNPVLGSGYRQDESEIKAGWIASAKSTLNGRLTWIERTQEGAAQRNFSGLTGEVLYAWTPTGKLKVNLSARREITPFQDTSGSHIVDNTLSVAPTWAISAKTTAHLRAARVTSDFRGAGSPVMGASRKDTLSLIEAGVGWSPASRLNFGLSLQHQERESNTAGLEFRGTIARITGAYRF